MDRKARHACSLRHAWLSAPAALPDSNGTRCPSAATGRLPCSADPAGLLVTGYDSRVDVTLDGRRYGASARTLLKPHPVVTWLAGPVATEWLGSAPLTDAAGRAHPHLTVRFHVRAYAGYERVLTDISRGNVWAFERAPRNFRYDVNISVNGHVRYTRRRCSAQGDGASRLGRRGAPVR